MRTRLSCESESEARSASAAFWTLDSFKTVSVKSEDRVEVRLLDFVRFYCP